MQERHAALASGLLRRGLRTTEFQALFATAGDESDDSAKHRYNGDFAGVHGFTSNFQHNHD